MQTSQDNRFFSRGLIPYALTALIITGAYVFSCVMFHIGESWIRIGMITGVTFCMTGAFLLSRKKSAATNESILLLIILAGMIMRIGYMLYTPYYYYEHDVREVGSAGHADYIYTLFSTGRLPQTNTYQFYQPPFAHILMALVVKIFSFVMPNEGFTIVLKAAQIVPCFASCALLLVMRSLCREVGLSSRASLITLLIVAVHPTFYLFSSSINNDSLMIFLYMTAILYTIRWYHAPNFKNILLLAASIGFAMMTKLSAFSVAIFTAPVFLLLLIQRWKERKPLSLFGQFVAFGAVSLPLGLWYPIRNFIKFQQMPNYIYQLSRDCDLFNGWASTTERFLSFPLKQYFTPPFCNTLNDYNLWVFSVKSAIFGEYTFFRSDTQVKLFLIINLVLVMLSLAAMVYVLVRGKEHNAFVRFGFFGILLIQIVFFILFNIQYPFGCTMDFRYIVPTVLCGAIYLAVALDKIKTKENRLGNALYYFGLSSVILFAVVSVLFFTI